MSSPSPRDQLILDHCYLVGITAQRLIPPHLGLAFREDAEGEGLLALVKAADRYDPAKGVFRQWAIGYIRGAMREFLRKEDPLPRGARARGEVPPHFVPLDALFVAGDPETIADVIAAPGPTPEEEVLERLAPGPLVGPHPITVYLAALPPGEREALWGMVVEGQSSYTVARRLGYTHKTAWRRRNRALRRLRDWMLADGAAP